MFWSNDDHDDAIIHRSLDISCRSRSHRFRQSHTFAIKLLFYQLIVRLTASADQLIHYFFGNYYLSHWSINDIMIGFSSSSFSSFRQNWKHVHCTRKLALHFSIFFRLIEQQINFENSVWWRIDKHKRVQIVKLKFLWFLHGESIDETVERQYDAKWLTSHEFCMIEKQNENWRVQHRNI